MIKHGKNFIVIDELRFACNNVNEEKIFLAEENAQHFYTVPPNKTPRPSRCFLFSRKKQKKAISIRAFELYLAFIVVR
jgi:hypothetical protein